MKKLSIVMLLAFLAPFFSLGQIVNNISIAGNIPASLTYFNDEVYFYSFYLRSYNPPAGFLFKTDGTSENTKQIAEVPTYIGEYNKIETAGDYLYYNSLPNSLNSIDKTGNVAEISSEDLSILGKLHFFQNGSFLFSFNAHLYISNGTPNDTLQLKNIQVNSGMCSFGYTAFFGAEDPVNGNALWKSDGTEEGTILLKNITEGKKDESPLLIQFDKFYSSTDGIFFTILKGKNYELWKSDGTNIGTKFIKTFNARPIVYGTNGSQLIFVIPDVDKNILWTSDGTTDGTIALKEVSGFNELNGVSLGGVFYFPNREPETGLELWRTDGTINGTFIFKDLNPGPKDGIGANLFSRHDNEIYFGGDNGNGLGNELWKTDGTIAGTKMVVDINPGEASSNPIEILFTDKGLFVAGSDLYNASLYFIQDLTTSIEDSKINFSSQQLIVAPNPAETNVHIQIASGLSHTSEDSYSLADMNGHEVLSSKLTNTKEFEISTESLKTGVYILKVQTGTTVQMVKIHKL